MKKLSQLLALILVISMLFILSSCSGMNSAGGAAGGYGGGYDGGYGSGAPEGGGDSILGDDAMTDAASEDSDVGSEDSGEGEADKGEEVDPEQIVLPAGMITAGAWNDNDNYSFWLEQFSQGEVNGKFYNYTLPGQSWGFNSLKRVKVEVTCGENVVAGAEVTATDDNGNTMFRAVTDAAGKAYLFVDEAEGNITVTSGEGSAISRFDTENRNISVNLEKFASKLNVIEIMLVVDVTGSMGDEITFLKAELADVIKRIAANDSEATIKLAMLFYRDTEDKVPFDYYDFTDVTAENGMAAQQTALNSQSATGGGDYPEAVDEALNIAVGKQWSTGATTKIIFHVLDAPAHQGNKYAQKLVTATKTAAEKGIRICPIICSGAMGDTEYTMREAAIYTGGTFILVTDDSGIGGSHHDPDLPNVTVELLNSLMVRLVNGYHTGEFADPVFWKEDPNLALKK